jgi:hypothetical protein
MKPKPFSSLNHFTVPVGMRLAPSCLAMALLGAVRIPNDGTCMSPAGCESGHSGKTTYHYR